MCPVSPLQPELSALAPKLPPIPNGTPARFPFPPDLGPPKHTKKPVLLYWRCRAASDPSRPTPEARVPGLAVFFACTFGESSLIFSRTARGFLSPASPERFTKSAPFTELILVSYRLSPSIPVLSQFPGFHFEID